jgi:hypothetical protein
MVARRERRLGRGREKEEAERREKWLVKKTGGARDKSGVEGRAAGRRPRRKEEGLCCEASSFLGGCHPVAHA